MKHADLAAQIEKFTLEQSTTVVTDSAKAIKTYSANLATAILNAMGDSFVIPKGTSFSARIGGAAVVNIVLTQDTVIKR